MTDLAIEQEITIEAPRDVVWRTITEPDQITRWFADRVEIEVRPGAAGTLVFHDKASKEPSVARLVIEAVEPQHRLAFRWTHPEGEVPGPGNSTLVEFVLIAEGAERTRLRVVETGLEATARSDQEKADFAKDHREGWSIHLGRLTGLYARGG